MEPLTYIGWDELIAERWDIEDLRYYSNGNIYYKFNKDEFVPIYGCYTDIFEPENVQELITFEELMGK